ncbi:hypothetical protein ABZ816_40125 [Actinosynnema sp. NPDC047251]|uniref:Uncharacterized protein n=1 Tax=Saccharothrix espanaensis (strain ATCC 51144 / DSM 44229 / JCM 9112 / NBRC 15066 / NRRL 15764) TaxID=1179773 RepID=K0JV13_SACES|nr:hypothetical protein [Saccharothrix espanaensis]CCH29357.1 hypothetical protein BN6_20350 [Saccharothrix espanaensis DSM 44229]
MSGYVFLQRPGEMSADHHVDDAKTWDASNGVIEWLMRFLANHVDSATAAAKLREAADHELQWLALDGYTEDEIRAIVRVIRDVLPVAVPEMWPDNPSMAEHAMDLVARTTAWARAEALEPPPPSPEAAAAVCPRDPAWRFLPPVDTEFPGGRRMTSTGRVVFPGRSPSSVDSVRWDGSGALAEWAMRLVAAQVGGRSGELFGSGIPFYSLADVGEDDLAKVLAVIIDVVPVAAAERWPGQAEIAANVADLAAKATDCARLRGLR